MHITVLIPTYRRPADLRRCLAALAAQERLADSVIVVCRLDDAETHAAIADSNIGDRLRMVHVATPGVVAALNAGLETVSGDVVAMTDDDAAPRPDWLLRIETHFKHRPDVGGVGGRDYVIPKSVQPDSPQVGIIKWFGRQIGNHHLGIGAPRLVHMLKGVNMSFRLEAIGTLRFDERLRGSGAQVHNELAFSLAIRRKGWKLLYDPDVAVDHYPAQRFDEDQRSKQSMLATSNSAYNETLTLLEHLPPRSAAIFIGWAFLIGARDLPGIVQAIRLALRNDPASARLPAVFAGRLAALRTSYGRPSNGLRINS